MDSILSVFPNDLPLRVALLVLLGAWSSLVSHEGVSVFHDGIRPLLPSYMAGSMEKKEFVSFCWSISVGFVLEMGLPLSVFAGITSILALMLPCDVLGIRANNWLTALLYGGCWGFICAVCVYGWGALSSLALISFRDTVSSLVEVFVPLMTLIPVIASARYLKGKRMLPVLLLFIGCLLTKLFNPNFESDFFFLSTGTIVYFLMALYGKNENVTPEFDFSDDSDEDPFLPNYAIIKKNALYLVVQGALIALAASMKVISCGEVDILPLTQQNIWSVIGLDLVYIVAFFPLFTQSCAATGVYVSGGFLTLFPLGLLCGDKVAAVLMGAVVFPVGVFLLKPLSSFLERKPVVSNACEELRTAMTKVMDAASLIGCCYASWKLLYGGVGTMIVAAFWLINEERGRKCTAALVPMGGLFVVWVISNIVAAV